MALPSFNLLSAFAGIGMLDEAVSLALAALGREARTVCYVEREAPAAAIMAARMEEGSLPAAPIWSDLATFDGRRWRGLVDIFTASPPCQPYSVAGKKLGNKDERSFGEGSGPLVHTLRIIEESEPAVVFFENVGAWVAGREQYFRPFGTALSALGYRIEDPLFIAASDVGAPHERERVFILAHNKQTLENSGFPWSRRASQQKTSRWARASSDHSRASREVADANSSGPKRQRQHLRAGVGQTGGSGSPSPENDVVANGHKQGLQNRYSFFSQQAQARRGSRDFVGLFPPPPNDARWRALLRSFPHLAPAVEPGFREHSSGERLVVDASRTDQLRATGNQVVALCAATAFIVLARRAGLVEI